MLIIHGLLCPVRLEKVRRLPLLSYRRLEAVGTKINRSFMRHNDQLMLWENQLKFLVFSFKWLFGDLSQTGNYILLQAMGSRIVNGSYYFYPSDNYRGFISSIQAKSFTHDFPDWQHWRLEFRCETWLCTPQQGKTVEDKCGKIRED